MSDKREFWMVEYPVTCADPNATVVWCVGYAFTVPLDAVQKIGATVFAKRLDGDTAPRVARVRIVEAENRDWAFRFAEGGLGRVVFTARGEV